jgi:hypothetical protein
MGYYLHVYLLINIIKPILVDAGMYEHRTRKAHCHAFQYKRKCVQRLYCTAVLPFYTLEYTAVYFASHATMRDACSLKPALWLGWLTLTEKMSSDINHLISELKMKKEWRCCPVCSQGHKNDCLAEFPFYVSLLKYLIYRNHELYCRKMTYEYSATSLSWCTEKHCLTDWHWQPIYSGLWGLVVAFQTMMEMRQESSSHGPVSVMI